MKKPGLASLISLLALGLSMTPAAAAIAPATKPSNGLTVSPAIQQIALDKGQTSATFNETVVNNSKVSYVVYLSGQNFTALGNQGAVQFSSVSSPNGQHGLASSLSLGVKEFALPPGASQIVPISILNANQLSPGGHYAAVTYAVNPLNTTKKANQINNNEVVGSLIFVTTYGQGTQLLQLNPVSWSSLHLSLPSSLNLVFNNNGNAQVTPRGSVVILNSANKEVARGIINTASSLVLPSSSLIVNVPIRLEGGHLSPGHYHLRIIYQTDASKSQTLLKSFVFVNGWIVILAVVILLCLAVLLINLYGPPSLYKINKH